MFSYNSYCLDALNLLNATSLYGKIKEVNIGSTEVAQKEKICFTKVKVKEYSIVLVEDIYECKIARKLNHLVDEYIYLNTTHLTFIRPDNFSSSLFKEFPSSFFFYIDHE